MALLDGDFSDNAIADDEGRNGHIDQQLHSWSSSELKLVYMQIAVHISHHKVKEADRGLVVVGGTARYGDLSEGATAIDEDQNDIIDKELQAEETERKLRHGGAKLLS